MTKKIHTLMFLSSVLILLNDLFEKSEKVSIKRTVRSLSQEIVLFDLCTTRKYLLRGYILGVLTHMSAWDRHWVKH